MIPNNTKSGIISIIRFSGEKKTLYFFSGLFETVIFCRRGSGDKQPPRQPPRQAKPETLSPQGAYSVNPADMFLDAKSFYIYRVQNGLELAADVGNVR